MFRMKGLAKNTAKDYKKKGALWSEFIKFFCGTGKKDTVLLAGLSAPHRSEVWAFFIWWLRAVKGGTHGGTIKILAAIKHLLGQQIGVEVLYFTDTDIPVVKSALDASANKTREELRKELERKVSSQKLPAFDELTERLYEVNWKKREALWGHDDIAAKAVWISVLVIEMFGCRISNLVKPSKGSKDHALQFQDIWFHCNFHGVNRASIKACSPNLDAIPHAEVESVEFRVLSTKSRVFKPTTLTCNNSDSRGRRAIRCLLAWCTRFGAGRGDQYLTSYGRVATGRKGQPVVYRNTTSAEVNKSIHEAAAYLQMPPELFSSKSYRSGLATRNELNGVPLENTMKVGGWTRAATVKKHYAKGSMIYGGKRKKGRRHGVTQAELAAIPAVQRAGGILPPLDSPFSPRLVRVSETPVAEPTPAKKRKRSKGEGGAEVDKTNSHNNHNNNNNDNNNNNNNEPDGYLPGLQPESDRVLRSASKRRRSSRFTN